MSDEHIILGIHITDRLKNAVGVQKVFTEYGCNIKTRVGLHRVDENACSPRGLILLEMFGDAALCRELKAKLAALEGIEVQEMFFEHA